MLVRQRDESRDVAIVGAGCRFPGAHGPEEFWDLLVSGRDAVGEEPDDRCAANAPPGAGGSVGRRRGAFLSDVHDFDAHFFGIVPEEVKNLDPQQRLLLEVAWEAVEDAGQTSAELAGSNTGVYVGMGESGHAEALRATDRRGVHAMAGVDPSVVAGRLAYHLDLRGPAIGLVATCATGLVALNTAVWALRSGEVDAAIVGAVNLMGTDMHVALSGADLLSADGKCRFGDEDADGFVRGEAVVALVLKRASDSVRDRSYATVLGSVVRGCGRSGGSLTSPGASGQSDALRAAYRSAGVRPTDIAFVEAHGPGTPVGDPAELQALDTVLAGPERERPCLVGSVKSNIGHTEIAAGLAGVLKAALVLGHRVLPPSLHVERPRALLTAPGGTLRHAGELTALPADGPIVAGVTGIGLSGAFGHVVLGTATPLPAGDDDASSWRGGYVLPVSATTPEGVRARAVRTAEMLRGAGAPALHDLCFSAGVRATHHRARSAAVADSREGMIAALERIASDRGPVGPGPGPGEVDVVLVFPGQPARWSGAWTELLHADRVFARTFADCAAAVEAELGWSPHRVTDGAAPSGLDRTHATIWAVQVALAAMLRSWGVAPDRVVGHSMGEVAAAVTAGALTVADGAAVVCRRARALAGCPVEGAMYSVRHHEAAIRETIGDLADRVALGVVNGPRSCVVSGEPDATASVVHRLREQGVSCRRMDVGIASHSPLVADRADVAARSLADVVPRPLEVPMHSTVENAVVPGSALDGRYWGENFRRPVRFAETVGTILSARRRVLFVEVAPTPVLRPALDDLIDDAGADARVCGTPGADGALHAAMLDVAATAYAHGRDLTWDRLVPRGRFVAPARYPWRHRTFRVDPPPSWRAATHPERATAASGSGSGPTPSPQPEPRAGSGAPPSVDEVLASITQRTSTMLGVSADEVQRATPLAAIGLSSLFAVRLAYDLRDALGVPVKVSELLEARSAAAVAEQLCLRLLPGDPQTA